MLKNIYKNIQLLSLEQKIIYSFARANRVPEKNEREPEKPRQVERKTEEKM
jgi:hypothetical protein